MLFKKLKIKWTIQYLTRIVFGLLIIFGIQVNAQNPPRVLFQAFWWDYLNSNYPNGWYNYLTELAPRLKGYGVDAVWIPPSSKGGSGTSDVGYGIFDHYDLGDKYQKGDVRTRLGTKDEYLRMIAVMHANGIEVIQDVVLNHVNGAGPLDAGSDPILGKGGKDPYAPGNQWKNFRYTSFSQPATDETANDYLNRNGRWPKNYQNFHKSGDNAWGHNDYDYPQHGEMFGPDICYQLDAINSNGIPLNAATYGISTIFNPIQSADYMKQQAIQWGVWLKKQAGVDGVRLDATKHFEWDMTDAFLWNLQNGTGLYGSGSTWANGGNNMFAVSEYVPEGGQPSMEQFIDGVQGRTGTFDFNLRGGIYDMVSGNGFYNISLVPGTQIDPLHRDRTVSFVNNHDTFRPQLDTSGNYIGWNTNSELRPHIDPFWDRLPAAYAIISAVDGSPQIFFEYLFNIGGTGKRYSHLPTSAADLPVRDHIVKILQARKVMNLAGGAYKVRSAEAGADFGNPATGDPQDLLAIERSAKAIIGVNDNGVNWQTCWIDSDFPPGTVLKDYSGANGGVFSMGNNTYTVPADKRVQVPVPPANSQYGGYCIIAPVGYDLNGNNPVQGSTTQEWEMSDDLGDSHPLSLQQGGALPLFGIVFETRTVGRIYSEAGKNIHLELYPEVQGKFATSIMLLITDAAGTTISTTGKGTITIDHTPSQTGFCTIKIANQQPNSGSQKVYVKATYTAPQVVDTSLDNTSNDNGNTSFTAEVNNELEGVSISVYPNPSLGEEVALRYTLFKDVRIRLTLHDSQGSLIEVLEDGYLKEGAYEKVLNRSEFTQATYYYRCETDAGISSGRIEILK